MSKTTPLLGTPVDRTADDTSTGAPVRHTIAYGTAVQAVSPERPTLALARALVTPEPERRSQLLQTFVGAILDDRYRIEGLIATGGMGAVFRSRHLQLDRPVAIKLLHPELTSDPTSIQRFKREAQSLSRIDHHNCVRVSDYGTTDDGITFLVMELIEGDTLNRVLQAPLPPARAVELIIQILEGLGAAHHHGVVHRDLKPDNILVASDFRGREMLKLVDFGIAKLIETDETRTRLTKTGFIFGTPRYMSPEQALGMPITERTDQYAVGLILYEMVAGRRAFHAKNTPKLIEAHVTSQHDPLPPDVPEALASIIDRLLSKHGDDRYDNARTVIQELERIRGSLEGVPAAGPSEAPKDDDLPLTRSVPMMGAPAPLSNATTGETNAYANPWGEDQSGTPPERGSSRMVTVLVAGMAVLGAVSGSAFILFNRDEVEAPAKKEPVAAKTVEAAPPPEPTPEAAEPPPPGARTVDIRFQTNVPATVIDVATGEVYGHSDAEKSIELPYSESALDLLLRSDGHDDLTASVTPDEDQTLIFELSLAKKGRRKSRRKDKAAPASASPSGKKDKKTEEYIQLDNVRDPFGKK